MTTIEIDNAHLYRTLYAAKLFACDDITRAGCSVALHVTRGVFVVEATNHYVAIRVEDRRKRYEGSDRTIDIPTRRPEGKHADTSVRNAWKSLMAGLRAEAKFRPDETARLVATDVDIKVHVGSDVFTFPHPFERMGTPPQVEKVLPKWRDWSETEHFVSRAFCVSPKYLAIVGEAFEHLYPEFASCAVFAETTRDPVMFQEEQGNIATRAVVMPMRGTHYSKGREKHTDALHKAWQAWKKDPEKTPEPPMHEYQF